MTRVDGKGIADVLRGLINLAETSAWLAMVCAAVLGIFLAGYALLRLYQVNQNGEGSALNWIVAFIIGSSLTCVGIVVGSMSFWFSE